MARGKKELSRPRPEPLRYRHSHSLRRHLRRGSFLQIDLAHAGIRDHVVRHRRRVFPGRSAECASRRHTWSARRISHADLLSSGQDNPLGLFGYIALLNIGVGAVILRKRWDHLLVLAAIGTIFMELLWIDSFFHISKAAIAFTVFLGFELQFLLIFLLLRKKALPSKWAASGCSALWICLVNLRGFHSDRLSRASTPAVCLFRFCFRRGRRFDRSRGRVGPQVFG